MMTLSGTLNLIIVGKLESDIAGLIIAIVGVSNIIMYNAWALFSGIGHTVNYLVAQSYGANQIDKAVERMQIALKITALVSVAMLLAGLFGAGNLLSLIGGEQSKELAEGKDYLQIR